MSEIEYKDEQILSLKDYEDIARAYSQSLKSKGFIIVQIDNDELKGLIKDTFQALYDIKVCLFALGGFMGTSKFYSLNDRHIKKLSTLFDFDENLKPLTPFRDKTKCLLNFLSLESGLIKNLIELSEKSNYEHQIKDIINARLTLLSQILRF